MNWRGLEIGSRTKFGGIVVDIDEHQSISKITLSSGASSKVTFLNHATEEDKCIALDTMAKARIANLELELATLRNQVLQPDLEGESVSIWDHLAERRNLT